MSNNITGIMGVYYFIFILLPVSLQLTRILLRILQSIFSRKKNGMRKNIAFNEFLFMLLEFLKYQ